MCLGVEVQLLTTLRHQYTNTLKQDVNSRGMQVVDNHSDRLDQLLSYRFKV